MVARYIPGIRSVIYGDVEPEEAIAQTEGWSKIGDRYTLLNKNAKEARKVLI
jgi:hypothetical protein